jgi:hypothetical protein
MTTHQLFRRSIALIPVLLLNALPLSAASLTFMPPGSQLDSDPINDIVTKPGDSISFDVVLDNVGLAGNLTDLHYNGTIDNNELKLDQVLNLRIPGEFDHVNFLERGDIVHFDGSVPSTFSGTLDRLIFTVLPGLDNNGVSDFSPTVVSAFANINGVRTNVTAQFTEPQIVEVQPVQGAPEPSSFLLLGLGLGLLAAYKRIGDVASSMQR